MSFSKHSGNFFHLWKLRIYFTMSGIQQHSQLPQQRPTEEPSEELQADPHSSQPGWWQAIREAANDPEWPPLPTMSSEQPTPQGQGRPVRIRPRGIDSHQVNSDSSADLGAIPQPREVPNQALVHFHCPACLTVLSVQQQVYQNQQCSGCGALVSPPRIVRS